ncbi:MAG TPA: hypothetical protein DCG12_14805, partial [Planctomycetaceae bacterium]|nr:hypothetical protein [Planctomycetaceae bacterium]
MSDRSRSGVQSNASLSHKSVLSPLQASLGRNSMLRIKGGRVYDPANNTNGEIRDLCISDDGKIVPSVDGGRVIDATGMIVFPGGVDPHTHVAGGAINFARAMTPEDHRWAQAFLRSRDRRSGLG